MIEQNPNAPLRATLCGSFHQGGEGLRRDYEWLRSQGVEILSPLSMKFVSERAGFIFTSTEVDLEPHAIERRHLRAIGLSDFVWFHLPDGYLGASGAVELGFAHALKVPVFARRDTRELGLQGLIEVCEPSEAIRRARERADRHPRPQVTPELLVTDGSHPLTDELEKFSLLLRERPKLP